MKRTALTFLAAFSVAGCAPAAAAQPEPTVTMAFRFTHFTPPRVEIPAGVPVTFTLRNQDPIEHEWIIGAPDLHAAHRTGTEPHHEGRPDELTVPPFSERSTTLTFAPGTYAFICHLPGHEAYGMKGVLVAGRARGG